MVVPAQYQVRPGFYNPPLSLLPSRKSHPVRKVAPKDVMMDGEDTELCRIRLIERPRCP